LFFSKEHNNFRRKRGASWTNVLLSPGFEVCLNFSGIRKKSGRISGYMAIVRYTAGIINPERKTAIAVGEETAP
jgi:peroxiredoxin